MDSGWRVNPGCGRRDSPPADPNFPPPSPRCPRNRGKWGQRGQRCGGEMRSWRRRSATAMWLGRREQAAARRERTTPRELGWTNFSKTPLNPHILQRGPPQRSLTINLQSNSYERGTKVGIAQHHMEGLFACKSAQNSIFRYMCAFFINKANIMALC